METSPEFWERLDSLLAGWPIIIDRPQGTAHPRFPDFIMPSDYGYLDGTSSMDGDGLDCWCGSLDRTRVTGIMTTLDLMKHDVELKLLIGCTDEEMATIAATYDNNMQSYTLIRR